MVVVMAKAYLVFTIAVLVAYAMRQGIFASNRLLRTSRHGLQDVQGSEVPHISVLIPMHNEQRVAEHILSALVYADYPPDCIEIIPIDDHSDDDTVAIIEHFARLDGRVHPLIRRNGSRGKAAALMEAIAIARGDVLVVFDADYIPSRGLLRSLITPFIDPEVGAVMGRVVPLNSSFNLITRLLDLERAAGYQVDQQARQNLRLIPQFGGTAGAFRKSAFHAVGGFHVDSLTEDTELTFRLMLAGWKIVYANRCECYEEVPQSWPARVGQIRRWASGHTECFVRFVRPMLTTPGLRLVERIDGVMLLAIYLIAPLLAGAFVASLFLFYAGQFNLLNTFAVTAAMVAFNSVGNFASFFEIGTATLLDGSRDRVLLLPLNVLNFALSVVVVTEGLVAFAASRAFRRRRVWHKTERFRT